MIILDFETNSANIHDVIEVAAFRIKREEGMYVIADTFHRYYFSEYEVNPYALAVHKLSRQRIQRLRDNVDYAKYFQEDQAFIEFCQGAKTLIAHNIAFELRHLGCLVTFEKHFCTMKSNKKVVGALNVRGSIKNPKLLETCRHYRIDFDEDQYHSAIYDVTKTLEILNNMAMDI
ncbi:MAG: 3'-5' exonuclease [Sulfuricurvum sp.]